MLTPPLCPIENDGVFCEGFTGFGRGGVHGAFVTRGSRRLLVVLVVWVTDSDSMVEAAGLNTREEVGLEGPVVDDAKNHDVHMLHSPPVFTMLVGEGRGRVTSPDPAITSAIHKTG